MKIITIDETSPHRSLYIEEIYKLYIVENVLHYSFIEMNKYNIEVSLHSTTNEKPHYLFIDLVFCDGFGHWVFESAIYLPIFHHLKKIYKNLVLVLDGKKQFKTLFLNFFGISESDVIYKKDVPPNNVCFFPSPISSLNDHNITESYKQIVHKFVNIFQTYTHSTDQIYDCIVMPRQTKENFKHNDRTYNISHIYTYLDKKHLKYMVLNTDDITDLKYQIQSIRLSSNIVLTDGSAFLVNNMFSMKTKVFIIGNVTRPQYNMFAKMKFLIDSITEMNGNTIEYIADDDVPHLA